MNTPREDISAVSSHDKAPGKPKKVRTKLLNAFRNICLLTLAGCSTGEICPRDEGHHYSSEESSVQRRDTHYETRDDKNNREAREQMDRVAEAKRRFPNDPEGQKMWIKLELDRKQLREDIRALDEFERRTAGR